MTTTSRKPKQASALHLGLNSVSAAAYAGWTGPLAACEFDARDMAAVSQSKGIPSTVLLTKQATRAALLAGLTSAAKALKSGDLFVLTYSGHGGQVPDGNSDEPDRKDETWCLYDGQLLDDELYLALSKFRSGVRILVLSDSCHSGSVTRELFPPPATPGQRSKLMPAEIADRVYAAHKDFYDQLQMEALRETRASIQNPDAALALVGTSSQAAALVGAFKPSVLLISGCQDNQTSMDGDHNGAFTGQLLKVWNQGKFIGNYTTFHARIRAGLPATQSPNLFTLGNCKTFLAQTPFQV